MPYPNCSMIPSVDPARYRVFCYNLGIWTLCINYYKHGGNAKFTHLIGNKILLIMKCYITAREPPRKNAGIV